MDACVVRSIELTARSMVQRRLLEIAIREFGENGLAGASTRGIAAAAGTAMSSITYHYGGKEGLYLASADYIAEQMGENMSGLWQDALPDEPEDARVAIHAILAAIADKMSAGTSETWAMFIAREQMRPTAAFERLYAGIMGQMLERLADLVCRATGLDDGTESRIVVVTLFGQVAALRTSRASSLQLLGGAVDLGSFKARIVINTNAILDRLIVEQKDQS